MALPKYTLLINAVPSDCTGLSTVTSENPLGVPVVEQPTGVPFCVTANRSVPLPVRPSAFLTTMSKPLITASDATVILAVT